MKSQFALLSLFGAAVAQQACLPLTTNFPKCALSCIVSAGSQIGCTNSMDVGCRCTSSANIVPIAAPCIIGTCGGAEVGPALAAGQTMCACVATAVDPKPTTTATSEPTTGGTTAEPSTSQSTIPTTTPKPPPTTTTSGGPGSTITSQTTAPPTCHSVSPCQDKADAVPDCGEKCIFSAAVTKAGCATDDFECQCSKSAVIQGEAQNCVIQGCGIPTALNVLDSVKTLCQCVAANPTTRCTGEPTSTKSQSSDPKPTDSTKGPETKTTHTTVTHTTCTDKEKCTPPPHPTCTDKDKCPPPPKPTCTDKDKCPPPPPQPTCTKDCPPGHGDGGKPGYGGKPSDGSKPPSDKPTEECKGDKCVKPTSAGSQPSDKPTTKPPAATAPGGKPEVVASSGARLEVGLFAGLVGFAWALARMI